MDPNTKFANVEKIKEAQDLAAAEALRLQQRQPELEAKKTAADALQAGLDACLINWQAY
jgi:hypothetical protein